jgi:sigma-E factor negative regulatory protein RseB
VIRINGEVRCYYPDAKVIRVEPRTFRNAFPSLSAQQQAALTDYYDFPHGGATRVAGIETQSWVFVPKDGLRYGHKFWADAASGLLVKARILDERNERLEQFAFTEIAIGAKIDREMVNPTWPGDAARLEGAAVGPGESKRRTPAGPSRACRPGSSRSSTVTGCCGLAAGAHISFIRTASSRCRCSSSRSALRRIRSVSPGRAASTSSSGSRTII